MSFSDARRQVRDARREFLSAKRKAAKKIKSGALRIARRESSGPFSQSELNRQNNPYARRHGAPLLPAEVINRQSGGFFRAWHGDLSESTLKIINDSPVAGYLDEGTRTMFRRPIRETIESYLEVSASDILHDALSSVGT